MTPAERTRAWQIANPERMRELRKRWRDNNKEKALASQRKSREDNRESYNAYFREYHAKNKEYRVKYINAHRRGRISNATPIWADKPAIRKFYVNCPEGHHVDHIIPLHGATVSGLHVLENLQYLPATENLKKGNSFALYEESER
jgi:hypothetical protein